MVLGVQGTPCGIQGNNGGARGVPAYQKLPLMPEGAGGSWRWR